MYNIPYIVNSLVLQTSFPFVPMRLSLLVTVALYEELLTLVAHSNASFPGCPHLWQSELTSMLYFQLQLPSSFPCFFCYYSLLLLMCNYYSIFFWLRLRLYLMIFGNTIDGIWQPFKRGFYIREPPTQSQAHFDWLRVTLGHYGHTCTYNRDNVGLLDEGHTSHNSDSILSWLIYLFHVQVTQAACALACAIIFTSVY